MDHQHCYSFRKLGRYLASQLFAFVCVFASYTTHLNVTTFDCIRPELHKSAQPAEAIAYALDPALCTRRSGGGSTSVARHQFAIAFAL